jgi:hypothetical protein
MTFQFSARFTIFSGSAGIDYFAFRISQSRTAQISALSFCGSQQASEILSAGRIPVIWGTYSCTAHVLRVSC